MIDPRGEGWDVEGEMGALSLEERDGRVVSDAYPDALARLWAALRSPHAGEILISLAPGSECVDWGGASHLGGGSHGSLHAEDSLVPLLAVGLPDGFESQREQWTLRDVADTVCSHFGLAPAADSAAIEERAR